MQKNLTTYEFRGMHSWVMIYDATQTNLNDIKQWLNIVWEPGYEEAYLINRLNEFDMGFDFIIIPRRSLELLKKWNDDH